jgi:hypothetical protein
MSVAEYYQKFTEKYPDLGKCLIKVILEWPTTPDNLQHNCSIFEQLNPDGLIVPELDENSDYYKFCCDYAYATMALKQRGLMNMSYYLLLDQLINSPEKGGKKGNQMGGMKLQELIKNVLVAFLLLGASEGLQTDDKIASRGTTSNLAGQYEKIKQEKTNAEKAKLEQEQQQSYLKDDTNSADNSILQQPANMPSSVSLFKANEAPVEKTSQLINYRQKQAEGQLQTLMDMKPWVLPEQSIIIADSLSEQQKEYFVNAIESLNSQLESLANDATRLCGEIVSDVEDKGVFTDEAFYHRILEVAEEEEEKQLTKRTADVAQNSLASIKNAVTAAATATSYGISGITTSDKSVNEKEVVDIAYKTVTEERNQALVSQVETIAYSMQYQYLCRATPNPRFILDVTSSDGTYSIKMKTKFGNDNTGTLLLYHVSTIQRIEEKMKQLVDGDSEFMALKSLKERISVEKKLIESSALFAPLDGVVSGFYAIQTSLVESSAATKNFENLVNRVGEFLPLTEADARMQAAIRKSINDRKAAQRQQVIEEWQVLAKDVGKGVGNILVDAVENVADVGVGIIEEGEKMAVKVVEGVGNVAVKGVEQAGNVLNVTVDEVLYNFYKIFPALVAAVGLAGAVAFGAVWFRRAIFSPGRVTQLPPSSNTALTTTGGKYTKKNKTKKNKNTRKNRKGKKSKKPNVTKKNKKHKKIDSKKRTLK